MERYWVFIDSKVHGPVEVPALKRLPGFNLLTQVCPEHAQSWRAADEVVEIKSYFLSPPRASSVPLEFPGNAIPAKTAPRMETLPPEKAAAFGLADPPQSFDADVGMPLPLRGDPAGLALPKDPFVEELPAETSAGALRVACEQCAYKNPRDIAVCMKCGTPLKKNAAGSIKPPLDPMAAVTQALGLPTSGAPAAVTPAATVAATEPVPAVATLPPGTTVELSVTKVLTIAAILFGLGGGGFVAHRMHKRVPGSGLFHFHFGKKKPPEAKPAAEAAPAPLPPAAMPKKRKTTSRKSHSAAAALPGMAAKADSEPETLEPEARERKKVTLNSDSGGAESTSENTVAAASYQILPEATPLKRRDHAPVDSPYAKKRRAEKALWTEQQKQAIQQVQRFRIYGAQRTIQRNVEILMQILRDREYNNAFETGRRIFLYDDVDWDAVQTDGPTYEVRLTFSGGRDTDGTARKSLRFAFATDLERGSVEAGGPEQVRSNTLHAFFDESRIPPEDRRDIARDTEELVQAAQPDGSPLAFDTVARHFSATYGVEAMKRVSKAYSLTQLDRKIAHEPKLVKAETDANATTPLGDTPMERKPNRIAVNDTASAAPSNVTKPSPAAQTFEALAKGKAKATTSKGVEYSMQSGEKRERLVSAKTTSKASAAHLFEVITGYDHYKQFVPDILTSEREGEDGNATIVHMVGLTRFMFFVFKVNLHLRVIEHPQQHTLEFERIAGEFDQFRGAVEIQENPGQPATIHLHARVVPKGHMPDWVLSSMAERFLVPILETVRNRAEAIN